MIFDLDRRTAALSVGDFADFSVGPREAAGGPQGLWRAQLGTHWHVELRAQAEAEYGAAAQFELPLSGQIFHRGWTLTLGGRIDQLIHGNGTQTLREIKSVTRPLPADETELRTAYPGYFIQLTAYAALLRIAPNSELQTPNSELRTQNPEPKTQNPRLASELVFVEASSGLAQTVPVTAADDGFFRAQLERVTEFLNLRLQARDRLRGLRFRPAFATPRPGQATTRAELTALFEHRPLVLFEAPTGFGKTGVLLEFALGQLRSGHFDRVLYLTSKSTGQIQVVRTLDAMTSADASNSKPLPSASDSRSTPNPKLRTPNAGLQTPNSEPAATPVAAWQVRAKAEHCVNATFHCVRDSCRYLAGAAERWPGSGLARFYLDEQHARDLDTLRAAGRDAVICPYEITRAALAFNDVWIGDYNYVFAPRNRGLFFEQPGFAAARTLLLVDEAHNLPSRVADAYSHAFSAADAFTARDELHRVRPLASLVTAWDHWCHALQQLRSSPAISAAAEDDLRHLITELARLIPAVPLDLAALGPHAADVLWQLPALVDELATTELPRLWWCPRDGELLLTCLDASAAIGATVREFGGVVLASATLTPIDSFAIACGLDETRERQGPGPSATSDSKSEIAAPARLGALTKRDTRKLYRQLTSAAELLRVEEAHAAASPALLRAQTPWRNGAYDIAFDARVDTSFQHRSHHYTTTASTIAALHAASSASLNSPARHSSAGAAAAQPSTLNSATPCVAVFFPSYAYAEAIAQELNAIAPAMPVALQPKLRDLAAQTAWVEQALAGGAALFLVLGSSFAESIDLLGGRVSHALVVGPALPEVNAVQRARMAEAARAGLGRDDAFRRVYQIPGMTKVNQALGRLVRAPGQRARVLLHCRRFVEPGYASLLAPEYQRGTNIQSDKDLETWLNS